MFRNLWVKLVGAFLVVNLVSMIILLRLVVQSTEREFVQYTEARRGLFDTFLTTRTPSISRPTPPSLPRLPDLDSPAPFDEVAKLRGLSEIFGDEEARFTYDPSLDVYVVDIAADPVIENQFLIDTRQAAIVAILITGVFAIIAATFLFRQITRPLHELRSSVTRYAQGDLSVRTPVTSSDEVGRLASAFNHMAAQLEAQEALRQQMVADVAHELRTPLTVMRGNIEAMKDGLLMPNEAELSTLHDEIQRLTNLIDDLRLLSQADAGQLKMAFLPLDVNELISRVMLIMANLASENAVKLEAKPSIDSLTVLGDGDRLQQVLINLVENALQNSPPGSKVEVGASREGGKIHIFVKDQGPGIGLEDQAHIFDRFWRGEKSRSRSTGGSGLGLSIVKQIVELHDGEVTVEGEVGEGSCFSVWLPDKV